jgi:hypothetical protein
MKNFKRIWKFATYTVVLILAACTSPVSSSPSSQVVNPDYTAAAQTIAAQLTNITGTGSEVPFNLQTPEITVTTGVISPTQTLPNTSTPLPTRTSAPSNPLTDTQTSTPTSLTTTSTGTPTPPLATGDPKASLGEPDFTDNFDDGSNWFIYTDEHAEVEVQDNRLTMTLLNADKYEAMMLSTQPILEDFYMEVSATTGDCRGLDRYGLIVRAPGFNPIQGYLFGFTCDGQYSLRIWDGVGFTAIIQWTRSDLILAGAQQTNRFGFSASGQQLKLFANGKLLTEIQDDQFPSGYFGLFAGAYATPGFSVSYTDFAYWLLP